MLMNLFNDGSHLNDTLKRFEEMNRDSAKKRETYSRLLTSIENIEKRKRVRHYLHKATAVLAVLLVLLVSIWYVQDGQVPLIDHQQASPSIQIESTDFTIVESEDGTWTFFTENDAENRVVGGLNLMTPDEMQIAVSEGAIFEKEEMDDFAFPTTRTLVHVKTMNITQTIHYYFQLDEGENGTVYDLYFHTPFFGKEEAFRIAQSFRVTD
jgi:hypothetical protein